LPGAVESADELAGKFTPLEAASGATQHRFHLRRSRTTFDCAGAMKAVLFLSDGRSKRSGTCEVAMKNEIFQENKARWEVFEWMGSTQSKIIWAVIAVIVALGIIYLVK